MRVEQDGADSQPPRERADVLAACSAEADQDAAPRIDAAPDRDLLDRLGHAGVGDLDEAGCDLVEREPVPGRAQLLLHRREGGLDRRFLQGEGKPLGLDASEVQVHVGEGESR